jgi:hypothetical protein
VICPDCQAAADLTEVPADVGNTHFSDDLWGHMRCQSRNGDRAPGQLPDCPCQHGADRVNAEPEDVTT